jgi:DNA-binding NtrC family response regulator
MGSAPAPRIPMTSDSTRPRILVVEDDAMVLATLKVTLECEQFQVDACSNPLEALPLLTDRDFSVVISDHKMPEMMGLDFLMECRRIRPSSSRILLTAVLNPSKVVDAIERGDIYRFIAKPWLRNELIAAIRDSVERHRLITENARLLATVERLEKELSSAGLVPAS